MFYCRLIWPLTVLPILNTYPWTFSSTIKSFLFHWAINMSKILCSSVYYKITCNINIGTLRVITSIGVICSVLYEHILFDFLSQIEWQVFLNCGKLNTMKFRDLEGYLNKYDPFILFRIPGLNINWTWTTRNIDWFQNIYPSNNANIIIVI